MKKILLLLVFSTLIFADILTIDHLQTTLPQKGRKGPINADISLVLQGRDLAQNRYQLMDVIQTALGGLDADTLLTARGKKALKKSIIQMADDKYGIEVDFVYIQNVQLQLDTLERCFDLLKEEKALKKLF